MEQVLGFSTWPIKWDEQEKQDRDRRGRSAGGSLRCFHSPYLLPRLASAATDPPSLDTGCQMIHVLTAPQKILTHHLFLFFGVRDQTLYRIEKYSSPNYTPNSQYILLQSSPTFYSLSRILHVHRHVGRLIGLWWQIETGRTKKTMEWINWKSSLSADNTTSP